MGWHRITDRLIDKLPSGASLLGRRRTIQSGGTPWPKAPSSAAGRRRRRPAYSQKDAPVFDIPDQAAAAATLVNEVPDRCHGPGPGKRLNRRLGHRSSRSPKTYQGE